MHTVPAFRGQKQEECLQFVARQGYKVSSKKNEREKKAEIDSMVVWGSFLTRLKFRCPRVLTRSFMKLSGISNSYSLQLVASTPSNVGNWFHF